SSSAVMLSSTSLWSSSTSKIRPSFSMACLSCLATSCPGEREIEGRALIDRAFRADMPTVPVNDALNGRQTDAGAVELLGPMQALKHPEQLVRVAHVESCAVVPDEDFDLVAPAFGAADRDLGPVPMPRELDRVRDQVHESDLQHEPVAVARRQGTHIPG